MPTIGEFKKQRRNANKHTERGLKLLSESVERDGWIGALTVAADGETFDGSARLVTAQQDSQLEPIIVDSDGSRPVIVRRTDIATADDPKAKRLGVMANHVTATDWEPDAAVLAEIAKDDAVIAALAKEDARLAELLRGEAKQEPKDAGELVDKAAELQAKWQVQRGDVWQVGRHRVMCGDSTNAADVAMLMQGERAQAVVTDSPYGMNVKGIENDDASELDGLFEGVLSAMPIDDAVIVNFQGARLFWKWLDAVRAHGQKIERALWLYKPNDGTFPWRGWLQTGQIILISSIGNPSWNEGEEYRHDTYCLNFVGDKLEKMHATPKPVEVIRHIVQWVCKKGAVVFDPFCGIAATLVACEQTGRIGRGMEIEPKYVAVTLERLTALGLEATRNAG